MRNMCTLVVLGVVATALVACAGAPKEARPAEPDDGPKGGLSPDVVRVTVRSHASQILACRGRSKAGGEVTGQVNVAWKIATDGRVEAVRVVDSTVNDPEVERCVASEVERFSFPPSTAPTVIERLPLSLGPVAAEDAGAATAAASPPRDAGAPTPRDAGAPTPRAAGAPTPRAAGASLWK